MDIDALLEAFQEFEKKGKNETCPELEQFLGHVAKTGQPMISWSQFKTYFVFKLEKVMDDFHASTPEHRAPHNPNVDYVPFEEMKTRILKIVDGYHGIPFTIQRLCELLMDPKRNYTGTHKFLMGLEKNVMVVSCMYPASDRNVNGPDTPTPLTRPKLSQASSLSSNGLPGCTISKESEPTTEGAEEHLRSDSSPSAGGVTTSSGIKNKHPEEEEDEEEDSEADKREVKRLKFDQKKEDETGSGEKESSCCKESESSSETPESSEDKRGTSCKTHTVSEDDEPSSTQTGLSEGEEESSEKVKDPRLAEDSTMDPPEAPSEKSPSVEEENTESSSDVEGLPGDKQLPSSSSSPDLPAEGNADSSNIAKTETEHEEND
ncbi:serine/threonine-protein phosphatase 4 regulatory subunit 2-A-like isoform X3 [Notothenia coriiceps]|uniref:Serine/threonine-protein phosphatase 4 regulatory subunit 2-A-like isoform X3 n=1 Tax=Notothenia coriiceps TaxID=8208 RepID=A0A6I9MK66_9TELE|nr:PREDICTED: serine/threonine-protein phosphatase 4 regulatory subunit 2-A-like isoform X3 [Notothenia coriiceps]